MTPHEMTIQIARAEGVMMALYGICRDLVIGCSVDEDKDGGLGDVIYDIISGLNNVYEDLGNIVIEKPIDTVHAIDKIVSLIVEHGHNDNQFKLGETIKYSPSAVGKILKEAVDNESK